MRRLLFALAASLLTAMIWAQGVTPLPSLHVDGRWLVDTHGNHVVLHGVMDTPSMWVNGYEDENGVHHSYWEGGYNSDGAKNCLNYFEKILTALETSKCNVFRLHLDPAWTNDSTSESFNPDLLKTFFFISFTNFIVAPFSIQRVAPLSSKDPNAATTIGVTMPPFRM